MQEKFENFFHGKIVYQYNDVPIHPCILNVQYLIAGSRIIDLT